MNFGLIIVNTRSVAVILDDINNKSGHGIQWLECIVEIACSYAFDVAIHACLCTYSEKERRDIFHFQNSLLCQLSNEGNKTLLWRVRPLKNGNPLLEPNEQLFAKLIVFCLDLRLDSKRRIR